MTTAIHSLTVLELTSEIWVSLGLCPFSEYPRNPSAPASQQPLRFPDLSLHPSHLCRYHHTSFLECLSFYMEVSSLGVCRVIQSCPTLGNPMDCSPPGSSVHRISQARVLEWVATSFSRDFLDPGIESASPGLAGRFLNNAPPGKALCPCIFLYFFSSYKRRDERGRRGRQRMRRLICYQSY